MKSSIIEALKRKHVKLTTPENYPKPGAQLKNKNNTEENQDMENIQSVEGCETVIAQLHEGIASRDRELEELIEYRATLIEDAALNLNGAPKLLKDTDDKIAFRTKDREVKRQAVESVSKRLERCKEALAREQERQRELSMGVIAREIVQYAAYYSDHLRKAAEFGDAIKAAVSRVQVLATPGPEQQWLNRLLETGPYLRAFEAAGMRRSIHTTPYQGPRAHVVSLDQHYRLLLDRWIMLAEPEPAPTEETESPRLPAAAEVVN